ncbi:hypothetical protein AGMMS50262_21880 [Bacteroidia bacterium]|nr:hypothetical protein AGMMS50262_21880 [Bacteroidia bacterium]
MKNAFKYPIYAVLFLIFFVMSCQQKTDYLKETLQLAGNNRVELEKVLQHYAFDPNDSLKYKAAVFLIENIQGHYSYKNKEYLEAYYHELDSMVNENQDYEMNKRLMEKFSYKYQGAAIQEIVEDIQIITAEYLIENIDKAFEVWIGGEWATHVTFDNFCEYILPYKCTELQPLDNWREYAREMLKADLDNLHYCDLYKNSAFQAATSISKEIIKLNRQFYPFDGIRAIPIKNIRTLAKLPFGTCEDYSVLALAVMRSKGIPIMEDFTPQWSFQPQAHSWNILLNNREKNMIFSAGSSNPGELHNPDTKMAKVFRRTYAINRDIYNLHLSENYIPVVFRNYFIKDVTEEYLTTCDVDIEVPSEFKNKYKYAYLAVFDNNNWISVHYGKIKNGRVKFEKMGKMCMYLPVLYGQQGIIPFSVPFHISIQGKIKKHEIIKNNFLNSTIYRKYFIAGHCYEVGNRMQNGRFEVANCADFSDAVVIHRIMNFTVQSKEFRLDTLKNTYRYWRYCGPNDSYCNIGELYFYQDSNKWPIYGHIIGTNASKSINDKKVVFDGDPLTLFDNRHPNGGWVGVDFGKPIKMNRIAYTPRGDGNDITPGDFYELFYWNNKWVSMGKKQATDIKLIYENLPAGTIYWIRNLSRGKDERIFSYENGTLKWW